MDNMLKQMDDLVATSRGSDEIYSLVRFQFPNLIADFARAYNYLFEDIPNSEKAECFVAACRVKHYLTHNRSHTKGIPTRTPYQAYKELYPGGKITAKKFQRVFSFANQIELNPTKECAMSKDSLRAVEIWRAQGESLVHINEYIHIISTDPYSAFNMFRLHAPRDCNLQKRQLAFREAIKLIGKRPENKIDALCAAYLEFAGKDILLENLLVYYKFTSNVPRDKTAKVLIIGASPLFARRWFKDNGMANVDITFAFESTSERDVFRSYYNSRTHAHFISVDELLGATEAHIAKHLMVFGNHAPDGYQYLIRKLKTSANTNHTLYYLGADIYITSLSSSFCQMLLEDDMKPVETNLLPAGIHDSSNPQRKMLLQCEFGYIDKRSDDIVQIKFYSLDKSGEFQGLAPKPYVAEQTMAEFAAESQSFRRFYRVGELMHLQKTDGKRQLPEKFCFSEEITFYATASLPKDSSDQKLRVEAYAKIPAPDSIKGDRLEASVKRTKKVSVSKLNIWVTEVYPYETVIRDKVRYSIREIIGQEYRAAYRDKPITFKTLVYLYPEIETDIPAICVTRLRELTGSDIGDTLVTQIDSTFAHFVLDMLYPPYEQAWLQARRVLADALDVAVNNGHCWTNEIKEEIKQDTSDHAALQIVRNNLRKQNFSLSELREIYKVIRTKIEHGHTEYLGILICMLYGLESNVVCAMKWKDFILMETFTFHGQPIYQLFVRRQLQNDGAAYKNFEKTYSFRLIPCHYLLTNLLLQERNRQRSMNEYLTEEAFLQESIVQGPTMVWAKNTRVIAPRELSRLSRAVIRGIGIPDQIIPIPDDERGTTESNLVNYSMDFFRANYRHYALWVSRFNGGELAYVLGNKGPTTYDRNYCDYANDKSQLILLIKQDRWISLLESEEKSKSQYIVKHEISEAEFSTQANKSSSADATIMITVPADSPLKMVIKSEYGCSGFFDEIEEVMIDGDV